MNMNLYLHIQSKNVTINQLQCFFSASPLNQHNQKSLNIGVSLLSNRLQKSNRHGIMICITYLRVKPFIIKTFSFFNLHFWIIYYLLVNFRGFFNPIWIAIWIANLLTSTISYSGSQINFSVSIWIRLHIDFGEVEIIQLMKIYCGWWMHICSIPHILSVY